MVRKSCLLLIAGVAFMVGACSSGGGATTAPATGSPAVEGGGTAGGGGASSQPNAGGGGGGAGSLNACELLSASDVQAAVGWAVSAGVLQNTDSQTDCEWTGASDDSKGVGITISDFDQTVWDAGANAQASTAVSGIGEAAYKGWPVPGDLAIKVKGYEVNVAVLDFSVSTAQEDQATLALANLVLPKL